MNEKAYVSMVKAAEIAGVTRAALSKLYCKSDKDKYQFFVTIDGKVKVDILSDKWMKYLKTNQKKIRHKNKESIELKRDLDETRKILKNQNYVKIKKGTHTNIRKCSICGRYRDEKQVSSHSDFVVCIFCIRKKMGYSSEIFINNSSIGFLTDYKKDLQDRFIENENTKQNDERNELENIKKSISESEMKICKTCKKVKKIEQFRYGKLSCYKCTNEKTKKRHDNDEDRKKRSEMSKKRIEYLKDSYVKERIKKQYGINHIPESLIELKRAEITAKREIKEHKSVLD